MSNQIEGVPEGWQLVAIRKMRDGERFLDSAGRVRKFCAAVDPERVAPVVDEIDPSKPKYRPFANAAEFEPHRDRWVRLKVNGAVSRIQTYFDYKAFIGDVYFPWQEGFECLEFDDGTPFGVEVNE